MRKTIIISVLLQFSLTGCATSLTLTESETKNKIYSGTIRQFSLGCAHATCLDFPFSLAADTVLLPITIPWTIVNYTTRQQEPSQPLADGKYIFEHKFAEVGHHKIESIKLSVIIKGNHITVINNDRSDVFPKGLLEEGTLMWHAKSSEWIIGNSTSDRNAVDVGGCSDGPTVVDLEKRIYWTC